MTMRRYALMLYLWYQDPMNIGSNIRNANFDEYESEADDIIQRAHNKEDIEGVFNKWFWPNKCEIDEDISKTILKIIGRSDG